jgi:hypothetical protein
MSDALGDKGGFSLQKTGGGEQKMSGLRGLADVVDIDFPSLTGCPPQNLEDRVPDDFTLSGSFRNPLGDGSGGKFSIMAIYYGIGVSEKSMTEPQPPPRLAPHRPGGVRPCGRNVSRDQRFGDE